MFNNGASLNGTGRLTIGDEGAGDLFVTNGGHLTSAEARLGGLLPTATGTAVVGGDGSLWETGNIAVGYGISGTLGHRERRARELERRLCRLWQSSATIRW